MPKAKAKTTTTRRRRARDEMAARTEAAALATIKQRAVTLQTLYDILRDTRETNDDNPGARLRVIGTALIEFSDAIKGLDRDAALRVTRAASMLYDINLNH